MGHPNDVRTLDACTGIRLNNRVILSTKRWMAYGHLPLCKQTSWNAAKHLLRAHTHNTFTIRFTMFIRDRFFPGYYGPLKYCECASNRGFFFRFVRVGVAQLFDSHWFRIHLYTHPTTTNHWNRGAAASVHVFFLNINPLQLQLHAYIDHTRLRQESELLSRSSSQHWSQSDLQSYASTTNIAGDNDAALVPNSDSLSSTETLKWLGSMSDISSSSHATNTSHISASGNYYHSSSH